ncbi:MAG: hypothetical protein NTW95_05080 [Candidatus Aminicenantes bacterium]|nr:hypothetical protein [Candidatus Aminicenantes bacterium]
MTLIAIPVLIMAGITLYVGFFYLMIWLRLRREIGDFYFFGLCATVAVYDVFSALLYNSRNFEASIWWQRGQFCTIALIALWMMLFAARFLRQKLSFRLWLLFGLFAAFVFASWIDSPLFLHHSARAPKTVTLGALTFRYLEMKPGPLLIVLFLLILAGILISYIYFVGAFRKRREQRSALIQAGLSVFFIATVNDILVGAGVIRFIYLLEYSFLAVILVMDFVMQRNYLALVNEEKRHASELEASLAKIKTLKGLLPVCTSCDKIQNDQGHWQPFEEFVVQHSEADFSRSICPDCARKLYPALDKKFERRCRKRRKEDREKKG